MNLRWARMPKTWRTLTACILGGGLILAPKMASGQAGPLFNSSPSPSLSPATGTPPPTGDAVPDPQPPQAPTDNPPPPPEPGPATPESPPPAPETAKGQADATSAIRDRLAKSSAQIARVLEDLKTLDDQIFQVSQQIAAGEQQGGGLQAYLEGAKGQISQLESRIDTVRKTSKDRARRVYKDRPIAVLESLLSAHTFKEMLKELTFWKSMVRSDERTIEESSRLKTDLQAKTTEMAKTSEDIKRRTLVLSDLRNKLDSSRQQRDASLISLRGAFQDATAAESAISTNQAEVVRNPLGVCSPGIIEKDRRLSTLLDWYAPAAGGDGFLPAKLSTTGVVVNGSASWYGPGFEGCVSSSGATYRSSQMTAASLSLPFGTFVRASSAGKSVVVVITDRGPYIAGRDIDLSKAAADSIGITGVGPVAMEILLPAQPAPAFP